MADTIPVDNHAIGDSGHVSDHNNIADVLGLIVTVIAQLGNVNTAVNSTAITELLSLQSGATLLPDPWHNVGSFANGWGSAASPAFVYRWTDDRRSVLLSGQATTGSTFSDGATVATLPTGYRPTRNQWVIPRRDVSNTDTDVAFRIDSSGVMTCWGIVSTTALVSFNTSFAIDT